jgi:cellulose synthase/poly-beta-1,6-N-acetylglucosamine synthase-like glycosyltransferase
MNLAALVVLVLLLLVAARRILFVVAALLPPRAPLLAPPELPHLCVFASIRDGGDDTQGLLEAIERLRYPADRWSVVLVDDGSRDGTGEILRRWVQGHPGRALQQQSESIGKAASLQRALALASPAAEVVAVLDADTRPEPSYLLELVAPFTDPRCGAVTGQARPLIEPRSPISLYAALEIWVYQRITLAAKDRLGLDPPTIGGRCGYRRCALEAAGGFPADAQAEDIAVSLALIARGWRTRFQPTAITRLRTVRHWRHFLHQRRRWCTSLLASTPRVGGLESLAVVLGYADRPLLLAALLLIAGGLLPLTALGMYLVPAALTLLAALWKARVPLTVAVRLLLWLVPMYLLDVAVSLTTPLAALRRRPLPWLSRAEAESSSGPMR